MPAYRLKTPINVDADKCCKNIYSLYVHAQPYAYAISNLRFVGAYFNFDCTVTLSEAIRDHLNIEAAP